MWRALAEFDRRERGSCFVTGQFLRAFTASSCQDALFLWELEKMDPAAGCRAVHIAAHSRPALVHLGAAEVRGQFEH